MTCTALVPSCRAAPRAHPGPATVTRGAPAVCEGVSCAPSRTAPAGYTTLSDQPAPAVPLAVPARCPTSARALVSVDAVRGMGRGACGPSVSAVRGLVCRRRPAGGSCCASLPSACIMEESCGRRNVCSRHAGRRQRPRPECGPASPPTHLRHRPTAIAHPFAPVQAAARNGHRLEPDRPPRSHKQVPLHLGYPGVSMT
jgi:hypothetical protein